MPSSFASSSVGISVATSSGVILQIASLGQIDNAIECPSFTGMEHGALYARAVHVYCKRSGGM